MIDNLSPMGWGYNSADSVMAWHVQTSESHVIMAHDCNLITGEM